MDRFSPPTAADDMATCVCCGEKFHYEKLNDCGECPYCRSDFGDEDMSEQNNGDFYNGMEWFACWLLDNVEGETITEEQLRPWAAKAWEQHLARDIVAQSAVSVAERLKANNSALIDKWRMYAQEASRDLGAAIDYESRTRLVTEARILERCARQLEKLITEK